MQEYYSGYDEDNFDTSYSYGTYDNSQLQSDYPPYHNAHGHHPDEGYSDEGPTHDDSVGDGEDTSHLEGDLRDCLAGDEFGRTVDAVVNAKPRILMMGPRRSGKTSIQQVVFRQMSPHETMFRIKYTEQIEVHDIHHSAFCNVTIWDYPGGLYGRPLLPQEEEYALEPPSHSPMRRQPSVYEGAEAYHIMPSNQEPQPYYPHTRANNNYDTHDPHAQHHPTSPQMTLQSQSQFQTSSTLDTTPLDETYSRASAIVYVLDANDEPYADSIQGLMDVIKRATRANPNIHIEVFLHKIDGELFVSDDAKHDCRREVKQQVTDELQDFQLEGVNISYHLTSIFDHSIREAFSKVVQKLVPHQETMEELLNSFCITTRMEKALLFDVQSKLYLCADHNPPDAPMTELSAEMIEVAIDVSGIYGQHEEEEDSEGDEDHKTEEGASQSEYMQGMKADTEEEQQGLSLDSTAEGNGISARTPMQHDALLGTMVGSRNEMVAEDVKQDDLDDAADYSDADNICLITLQNGQTLYLKEVDARLALICWGPRENFRRRNLIDYNIGILKNAVRVLKRNPERT